MTLRWVPGWNGLTEPEAVSYVAAVEAADGQDLEFGVARAINDFVVGCKNDGIWDAIKACCILAGARTTNGALVPLVGNAPTPYNFDLVGDTDYNRETGLKGDGSTKYLNSNRNSNADPQNNTHIAVQISTQSTGGINGNFLAAGDFVTYGSSSLQTASSNTNMFTRSRNATGFSATSKVTGFFGLSRSSSTAYNRRFSGSTVTETSTSQTPVNDNYFVFRGNDAVPSHTNARLSFYSIGESLDLALLDTRVSNLMTAIGAAIP